MPVGNARHSGSIPAIRVLNDDNTRYITLPTRALVYWPTKKVIWSVTDKVGSRSYKAKATAYSFTQSDAVGFRHLPRVSKYDIELESSSDPDIKWQSGVALGNTVWFVDSSTNTARAWTYNATDDDFDRDNSRDFYIFNGNYTGAATDGTNLFFLDNLNNRIRAWNPVTKARVNSLDLSLPSLESTEDRSYNAIATDGVRMWVVLAGITSSSRAEALGWELSSQLRSTQDDFRLNFGTRNAEFGATFATFDSGYIFISNYHAGLNIIQTSSDIRRYSFTSYLDTTFTSGTPRLEMDMSAQIKFELETEISSGEPELELDFVARPPFRLDTEIESGTPSLELNLTVREPFALETEIATGTPSLTLDLSQSDPLETEISSGEPSLTLNLDSIIQFETEIATGAPELTIDLSTVTLPVQRVRNEDAWEIDWGNNGYQHSAADVTVEVLDYLIQYGLNAESNDDTLLNTPASGTLVLDNSHGYYSSETSSIIERAALRRRHLVRLRNGTNTLWEGFIEPTRQVRSIDLQANFKLLGKVTNNYRQAYRRSQTIDTDVQTVLTDVLTSAGITPSTLPTGTVPYNTGTIFFDSSVRSFLNKLANFSGGYALEDHEGKVALIPYRVLQSASAVATIDNRLDIDANSVRTYIRDGLVRNTARLNRVGVTQAVEQDLAVITLKLFSSSELILTANSLDQSALAIDWTAPDVTAVTGATIRPIAGDAEGYTFGITPTRNIDTELTIRGRAWRQSSGEERLITDKNSVTQHDEREIEVPPWLSQDSFSSLEQFIIDISRDQRYTSLELLRWQKHPLDNQLVDGLRAGQVITVTIQTPQNEFINEKAFIAGIDLLGGENRVPRMTLYLVSIDAESSLTNVWGRATWAANTWGA